MYEGSIITDGTNFIPDEPAQGRYRVQFDATNASWYDNGADAVEAKDKRGAMAQIYDEWAEQFVSDGDAMCGFPKLTGPKAAAE